MYGAVSAHLGIGNDETTPDGQVTLERVECNAACDYAPVVMVNWEVFDNVTPDAAIDLVYRPCAGEPVEAAYNLGSGEGASVLELMHAIRDASGIAFEPEVGPRRAGDPARIVADGSLAARDLDWRMRHTIADMVASAWSAEVAAAR